MTEEDISSACRLSTQAGWNQTSEDWERLARLDQGNVKVWRDSGEVRASYSIIGYGHHLAWIGMILVDETYRGRGLGKIAFQLALEDARADGFQVLGLDATDLGEPIYIRSGFESIAPIVRWQGTLRPIETHRKNAEFQRDLHPGVLELDFKCSGEDRSPLLRDLAHTATLLSLGQEGKTVAYAAVRPGRTALQVGPVVASSPEHFAAIFDRIAEEFSGQDVICDLLKCDGNECLIAHGLQPLRHLKRMTLPAQSKCLSGDGIWCGAGFEWG